MPYQDGLRSVQKICLAVAALTLQPACAVRSGGQSKLQGLDVDHSNIATPSTTAVKDIHILPNTRVPKGVFAFLRPETSDFVLSLYKIIRGINQQEHLQGLEGPNQEITLVVVATDAALLTTVAGAARSALALGPSEPLPAFAGITNAELLSDPWLQDWGDFVSVGLEGTEERGFAVIDIKKWPSFLTGQIGEVFASKFHVPLLYLGPEAGTTQQTPGNLGGNLEVTPEGQAYSGDNMTKELVDDLAKYGVAAPLRLPAKWLGVGHVDEMVSYFPAKNACPGHYALAHAYPFGGLTMLVDGDDALFSQLKLPFNRAAFLAALHHQMHDAGMDPHQFASFDLTRLPTNDNEAFVAANLQAELKMRDAVAVLTKTGSCKEAVVGLPMLFGMAKVSQHGVQPVVPWGIWQAVGLTAAFPSPVNSIVLRNHIIVPDPGAPAVRDLWTHLLQDASGGLMQVHFIDTAFFHANEGEAHCATAVVREDSLEFPR